jgi:hypothetical protein
LDAQRFRWRPSSLVSHWLEEWGLESKMEALAPYMQGDMDDDTTVDDPAFRQLAASSVVDGMDELTDEEAERLAAALQQLPDPACCVSAEQWNDAQGKRAIQKHWVEGCWQERHAPQQAQVRPLARLPASRSGR